MARLERYEGKCLRRDSQSQHMCSSPTWRFIASVTLRRPSRRLPFGLGVPEFNRPGMIRISEAYRRKQKHIDTHIIGQSIERYLSFPTTFDGKLLSESFGQSTSRVVIGETYFFPDAADGG
jgi:hypothetical protein